MEMMTVKEVAGSLKVSERTIWGMLSRGGMPQAVRVGRCVRWRRGDVENWIAQGCPSRERFEQQMREVATTG